MNGVEDLPGKTAPFGFFDPAGFSKGKSEGEILKWREAEVSVRVTGFLHPPLGSGLGLALRSWLGSGALVSLPSLRPLPP